MPDENTGDEPVAEVPDMVSKEEFVSAIDGLKGELLAAIAELKVDEAPVASEEPSDEEETVEKEAEAPVVNVIVDTTPIAEAIAAAAKPPEPEVEKTEEPEEESEEDEVEKLKKELEEKEAELAEKAKVIKKLEAPPEPDEEVEAPAPESEVDVAESILSKIRQIQSGHIPNATYALIEKGHTMGEDFSDGAIPVGDFD